MNDVPREDTGIQGLDKLLGGGVPKRASVLVIGYPGTGKTTLVRQVAYHALSKGERVVFVTTGESPKSVVQQMKARGQDVEKYSGALAFVDAYSWRVGEKAGENVLSSITRLDELLILVQNAMQKGEGGVLVLDSLTDLLLHNEEKSVYKFVQLVTGKAAENGYTSFFVLEDGVHPSQVITTLEYITSGTIELRIEGEKRMLRIKRMMDTVHPLSWIPFRLEKGVDVEVGAFFQ